MTNFMTYKGYKSNMVFDVENKIIGSDGYAASADALEYKFAHFGHHHFND